MNEGFSVALLRVSSNVVTRHGSLFKRSVFAPSFLWVYSTLCTQRKRGRNASLDLLGENSKANEYPLDATAA
jgi:hypothetical protein